jgi:hypothetical protein
LEFLFQPGQPLKVTITHLCGVVALPYSFFPRSLEDDRMEWRRRELTVAELWSSLVGSLLIGVTVLLEPGIG